MKQSKINFNDEEMKLILQAVKVLYNNTIGEMMYKTDDDLRNLIKKIEQNET